MSDMLMISVEGHDFLLRYFEDEWVTMAPACPICMEFQKTYEADSGSLWAVCCGMRRELIE